MPERFKVQFTASQEYVDLIQQAKDLSSHALPHGSLEQLHLQAMRLLVSELKKRRCAAVKQPRKPAPAPARDPRQRQRQCESDCPPKDEPSAPRQRKREGQPQPGLDSSEPRQRQCQRRSRHVPAGVQREVWARDGGRCSFVDSRGKRCRETAFLEHHHLDPRARGGPHSTANLTLRCHVHNALAAEQDFGRDFIQAKRAARVEHLADP